MNAYIARVLHFQGLHYVPESEELEARTDVALTKVILKVVV